MRELSDHDKEVAAFIQSLDMDELVTHLATMIASIAHNGVVEHDYTPDEALHTCFAGFGQAIAGRLEVLRPHYEERCEADLFEASVNGELDELEIIDDADRAANRVTDQQQVDWDASDAEALREADEDL